MRRAPAGRVEWYSHAWIDVLLVSSGISQSTRTRNPNAIAVSTSAFQPRRLMIVPAAGGCKQCWAVLEPERIRPCAPHRMRL
jgi:hypothetical protein